MLLKHPLLGCKYFLRRVCTKLDANSVSNDYWTEFFYILAEQDELT